MIPKKIHYCWLSDDSLPNEIAGYISKWKEILPDYEIKLWNKNNFDINRLPWTKEAYENGKYAFASDYIRFYALYNEGGIYLDSDVEVIKSFDDLLDNKFFWGFEFSGAPEAAVLGSEPGVEWIRECMRYYEDRTFINGDGKFNMNVAPLIVKQSFEKITKYRLIDKEKIIKFQGGSIFPNYYFSCKDGYTGKIRVHEETYCIHHFSSSWLKQTDCLTKLKKWLHIFMRMLLGTRLNNEILYRLRTRSDK